MEYYVYIMANDHDTAYYIGVTDNIARRVWEHKTKADPKGFSSRYNVHNLVYVEVYNDVNDAIRREKQIKKWSRNKKTELIMTINPDLNEIELN